MSQENIEHKLIYADELFHTLQYDVDITGSCLAKVKRHIENAPAVVVQNSQDEKKGI